MLNVREDACGAARGLETVGQLEGHGDTRERAPELIHRYLYRSDTGVVEVGLAFPHALEDNEVFKVPVDDGGLHTCQIFSTHLIGTGFQTIHLGCQQDVLHRTAVAAHAARLAHLLQGKPLAVVRKYHRERGSPTLHGFHLHHHGHFLHKPTSLAMYSTCSLLVLTALPIRTYGSR